MYFLVFRLKFQSHKVQLKGNKKIIDYNIDILFQSHKVQLKANIIN